MKLQTRCLCDRRVASEEGVKTFVPPGYLMSNGYLAVVSPLIRLVALRHHATRLPLDACNLTHQLDWTDVSRLLIQSEQAVVGWNMLLPLLPRSFPV